MRNPKSQSPPTWTVLDALRWTTGYFETHRIDSPRLTAEILLSAVLVTTRIDLYMHHDQPLSENELAAYRGMIRRRVAREPVAYILGEKEFWGYSFTVTPDVLIPRPETEHLLESALKLLDENDTRKKRIADLGTGSGVLVVCLAAQRPDNIYFAVDRSPAALEVARKNARHHGVAGRIDFFAGSWLESVDPKGPGFDMIVSNPPYIPSADIGRLEPEVKEFEPCLALDGAQSGLESIEKILWSASAHLVSGGYLLIEIGWNQKEAVNELSAGTGMYAKAEFVKDYSGHDRVAVLCRNNMPSKL